MAPQSINKNAEKNDTKPGYQKVPETDATMTGKGSTIYPQRSQESLKSMPKSRPEKGRKTLKEKKQPRSPRNVLTEQRTVLELLNQTNQPTSQPRSIEHDK